MHFDIIIIGAGPTGLSFARSLASSGLNLAIIEQSSIETLRDPAEDGREIALTHLSVRLMKEAGSWQKIPAEEIAPIQAAKVFDGDSDYSLDFDNSNPNLEALGYLIPNHVIRKACYEAVEHQSKLQFFTEVKATDVKADDNLTTVKLNDGRELTASLLVSCDSRFSDSRKRMGVAAEVKEFSRTAIVCRMEHVLPHDQTAFECFHYGRTLALLPMNNNCSSVVVTVNSRDAEGILQMSDAAFNRDITDKLKGRLGEMTLTGPRHHYPLVGVHASRFVSDRYALIGDAAVGMHPVTAHGFNLGLRGQNTLAELICNAAATGQDFADKTLLKRYELSHMRATRVLYHGTNSVVGLFTNEQLPARLLRKLTLRLANNFPPVKRMITHTLTEEKKRIATLPLPPFVSGVQHILTKLPRPGKS